MLIPKKFQIRRKSFLHYIHIYANHPEKLFQTFFKKLLDRINPCRYTRKCQGDNPTRQQPNLKERIALKEVHTITKYVHKNKDYFDGQEISEYGKEHGYVDYRALAKGFSHILNNTVIGAVDDWEIINGGDYDEETDDYKEFFQYYIISTNGAQVLEDCTDETVYYSETLDMYVWAVDHFGTSWDYVLTDIPIED